MPALFPDIPTFVACALIMAAAQFIYATVGFGAGMFSMAMFALILPDLTDAVTVLLFLTFVTELGVLLRAWRHARARLLLGLVPTMALGLWLGTEVLVAGNAATLKRLLGVVVGLAGVWFLYSERRTAAATSTPSMHSPLRRTVTSVSAGLASGLLGGLYGTGGPPVIICLKGHGLDKSAFRATLLWYFMLMSLLRAAAYGHAGVLTLDRLLAAAWLLPGSLIGVALGMTVHQRLSERVFARTVSVLLITLGAGLLTLGGR
jgi:uncharacterized membrane protein YfcA